MVMTDCQVFTKPTSKTTNATTTAVTAVTVIVVGCGGIVIVTAASVDRMDIFVRIISTLVE